MTPPAEYPPDPHVLRDLEFSVEASDHRSRLTTTVDRWRTDSAGHTPSGLVALLMDVGAAPLALREVAPDWIATADLSFHGRAVGPGTVTVEITPLRAGSKLIVLEARVSHDGVAAGLGHLTFARIPGSASEVVLGESDDPDPLRPAVPLDEPLVERCAIEVLDAAAGVVEMPIREYVRNSFGAVNGGVLAMLADEAARTAGQRRVGRPVTTTDLEVHYLAQARRGPIRTRTSTVHATEAASTDRIELVDSGHDDLPLVVAVATTAAAD